MKILVYCYGNRGDIQPYLALSYALTRAGHDAVLVAPRLYGSLAAEYGVDFLPLNDEAVNFRSRTDVRELQANSGLRPAEDEKLREEIRKEAMPLYAAVLQDLWAAAANSGADLIVHSHASREAITQIAERLGIPSVHAPLYPNFVVSREYPAFGQISEILSRREDHSKLDPQASLPPALIDMLAAWRTETLGLPMRKGFLESRFRHDGSPVPVLHGFSRHLLKPADDWPDWVHTHGFWHLPPAPGWEPSEELTDFLREGQKPIFVGFGSAVGPAPETTSQAVLDAVRMSGHRAVVVEGWGGLKITDPPENVLPLREAPYEWLLPQTRLAVTAGSPGAHNCAARAGVPQVLCPYEVNQMMWSEHLRRLGVATTPIKQRELTADALAKAIDHAAGDPVMAKTAAELGRRLRAEDGAAAAVGVLERIHADSRVAR